MPAEIFNPNPVVFAPTKSLGRKSELLSQSLWFDEHTSSDDEADDVELIDQDEVFGTNQVSTDSQPTRSPPIYRPYPFNIRSRTPEYAGGTESSFCSANYHQPKSTYRRVHPYSPALWNVYSDWFVSAFISPLIGKHTHDIPRSLYPCPSAAKSSESVQGGPFCQARVPSKRACRYATTRTNLAFLGLT